MDRIEKRIIEIIDQNKEEIIAIGRDIFANAELGYKEFRTAKLFADKMQELGCEVQDKLAITGVKAYLKEKKDDELVISLMGELDALPIANHPLANPETGASHCCGHNAQIAGVIGAAIALCDPEIKNELSGNVVFFAVPAEEFVEIEFKNKLMEEGKISYGGGKCELIKLGALDDIDITVGHHIDPDAGIRVANATSNGFVNKIVKFVGKASHAAGSPHKGIDALAAANLATNAINSQRESFRDCDAVRIHGFISNGGEAMNVIADEVTMEYSVRANNIPAFMDASEKFDRSIRSGAIAMGAGVEITTFPGYLPTVPLKNPLAVKEAIEQVNMSYNYPVDLNYDSEPTTGSTDFGDLSSIMPLLQFKTGGYSGFLHNISMNPEDEELAYVVAAKVFALTAYKLLKNNNSYAKEVLNDYKQVINKADYIKYMDSVNKKEVIEINPLPILE